MPDNSIRYEFAPTGGGRETGFNDPAITTFNTDVPRAIVRESIQNSIDVSVDPSGNSKVFAEFSLFSIPMIDIPSCDSFKKILLACRDYVQHNSDGRNFFQNAIGLLSDGNNINILRISDYGTTGLTGEDDDRRSNFYNFLKSVGSSAKSGSQGGSYGLGKASFFAASAFRTIFVSSICEETKHIFMGTSELVSHSIDGRIKQGNGSFGLPGQKPIRDAALIPNVFRRSKQGTDINILGYLGVSTWQEDIAKAVLRDFWYAILKGLLEVKVGDVIINKETIHGLIHRYFSEESRVNGIDDNSPLPYFEAFIHREATSNKVFKEELPTLGEVNLYVLLGDKLPKKVAYFRKTGMLVKNRRYICLRSYAAVFVCENEKGNEILRKMEPPAHDDWTKDSPNAKKEDGKTDIEVIRGDKELKSFIKACLRSLIDIGMSASLQIQDLSRYLYLPGDETSEDEVITTTGTEATAKPSIEETATETGAPHPKTPSLVIKGIKPAISKERSTGAKGDGSAVVVEGDEMEGGGVGGGGAGRGEDTGGKGKTGTGEIQLRVLSNVKGRTFANKRKDGVFEHVVILKAEPDSKCNIRLIAGTDDSFDEITIEQAHDSEGKELILDNNMVKDLIFNKSGETTIKVVFDSHDRHSLMVMAYETF